MWMRHRLDYRFKIGTAYDNTGSIKSALDFFSFTFVQSEGNIATSCNKAKRTQITGLFHLN